MVIICELQRAILTNLRVKSRVKRLKSLSRYRTVVISPTFQQNGNFLDDSLINTSQVSENRRKEKLLQLIEEHSLSNSDSSKMKESQASDPNNEKHCIICMVNEPNSIFYPCLHGGFCFDCATHIIESDARCHYCRKVNF